MPRRSSHAPRARRLRLALFSVLVLLAAWVVARADGVQRLPSTEPAPILLANAYTPFFAGAPTNEIPLPSAGAVPYGMSPSESFAPQPPVSYEDTYDVAEEWTWQVVPVGLIWRSYLAGVKEPRFSVTMSNQSGFGNIWDATLGGRVALLRWGTTAPYRPEGWEIDLEGAAMPRIQPMLDSSPLVSCDYRIGVPVTYGSGPWQFKTGYYHVSAHLGDEYMIDNPSVTRINYVRDAIMFGVGYFYTEALRLFAEFDYAAGVSGGAEPCEFQFGVDYSPLVRGGAPFAAVYGNLRQEVDFGGFFVVQAGWQWRGGAAMHTFRIGAQYINGQSSQYEFFNQFEQHGSFGIWYDF